MSSQRASWRNCWTARLRRSPRHMMALSSSARNPIDSTAQLARRPRAARGGSSCRPWPPRSPRMPSRRGTEKPQMSASSTPTTVAEAGQGDRQVDRDRGLADPALARRDGEDPRRRWACRSPGRPHGPATGPRHDRARGRLRRSRPSRPGPRRTPGRVSIRVVDVSLQLGAQGQPAIGQGDLDHRPRRRLPPLRREPCRGRRCCRRARDRSPRAAPLGWRLALGTRPELDRRSPR